VSQPVSVRGPCLVTTIFFHSSSICQAYCTHSTFARWLVKGASVSAVPFTSDNPMNTPLVLEVGVSSMIRFAIERSKCFDQANNDSNRLAKLLPVMRYPNPFFPGDIIAYSGVVRVELK